jgi:hypothetical protein
MPSVTANHGDAMLSDEDFIPFFIPLKSVSSVQVRITSFLLERCVCATCRLCSIFSGFLDGRRDARLPFPEGDQKSLSQPPESRHPSL